MQDVNTSNLQDENILPAKLSVMGVGLTPFAGYDQAVQSIEKVIAQKQSAFVVAINPEKIYRANQDSKLAALLNSAEIGICDGIGAKAAARFLNGQRISRVTGVALFLQIIPVAAEKGWRIFLLGADARVNSEAKAKMQEQYPSLNIVGSQDGFFSDSDAVVAAINDSGADILFVAMGSPRQEEWIQQHRSRIRASLLMGVGGTFDVVAGHVAWAPGIFRKTGTEWLYRLIREPRRLRRQLVLPKFVWLMVKYKLGMVKG